VDVSPAPARIDEPMSSAKALVAVEAASGGADPSMRLKGVTLSFVVWVT
jgi:hypothetical protein